MIPGLENAEYLRSHAEALGSLALEWVADGRPTDAVEELEARALRSVRRALELAEDDAAVRATLARVLTGRGDRTYRSGRTAQAITDIKLDKVFIGSCTNSRIEDLRAAAAVVKGRQVADNVKLAMVVPGSGAVKEQAEQEGLDKVFTFVPDKATAIASMHLGE